MHCDKLLQLFVLLQRRINQWCQYTWQAKNTIDDAHLPLLSKACELFRLQNVVTGPSDACNRDWYDLERTRQWQSSF